MQATTELVLTARCLGRALRLGQWHKLPFFLSGAARATRRTHLAETVVW